MPGEDTDVLRLVFEKAGEHIVIELRHGDDVIFYANPVAKGCAPVIRGAIRMFETRFGSDVLDSNEDNGDGGAFH